MNILKRIYQLLLPEEKIKGWRVVGTSFLTAILDFVGLAALLPVLYFLLDGGESRKAGLWFCLLAVGVMSFKSIVVTLLGRYQQHYLLSLYKRMSFSLFQAYYNRGLLYIREQGVNRLGYEVNFVCYSFSLNMLAPLLRIVSDGLLIILVMTALLIYDWFTALILFASFIPFMMLYIIAIRKHVREYGKQELEARKKQSRIVNETFGGYAELEVNGAFYTIKDSFQQGLKQITDNRMKMETLLRMPLFLSELSVIVGLTLLTLLGSGDIKTLVGVFAIAAFRLLPALRGILSGWTQIQNTSSSLQIIEEGLKDSDKHPVAETCLSFDHKISIDKVTYAYENDQNIFHEFSCHINKGEYIGIKGYSGVGKSTLFNMLLGFLKPQQGEIRIDNTLLTPDVQADWLKKTGYVQQDVFIFQGSLAENIALGCKDIDKDKIRKVLEQVSLHQWVETLPHGIDTPLGEFGGRLSGGQKQRIGIARALYKEAEVILLDEATSALDNHTEKAVNETLYQLKQDYPGLTILSIAHRESSLAYCDRIINMDTPKSDEDD